MNKFLLIFLGYFGICGAIWADCVQEVQDYGNHYDDPAKAFIFEAYSKYAELWWSHGTGEYEGCGNEYDQEYEKYAKCVEAAESAINKKYLSPDFEGDMTCLDGGPSFNIDDLQIARLVKDKRYNACMPVDHFEKLPDGTYDYYALVCMRYTLEKTADSYLFTNSECYRIDKQADAKPGDNFLD